MKKDRLVSFIFLVAFSLSVVSTQASAATEWINESRDYSVGEWVGNWQVLEYKDAVAYNSNNAWTTEGVSGGTVDANGSSVLWFYYPGSYAAVDFTQPSTSVAFMLQSDANDGLVNLYVDDTEVLHHFDMQTLPGTVVGEIGVKAGTLIVSGLQNGPHSQD